MKQLTNTKAQYTYVPATRAQKIWGVVALVGLFACGVMIGLIWRGNNSSDAVTGETVQFTESQCNKIARKIDSAIFNNYADQLAQYQKIYAQSCGSHIIVQEEEVVSDATEELKICEKIEKLLLRGLQDADSSNPEWHVRNASVYEKVSQRGCPENAEKYKQLAAQETAIANALGAQSQTTTTNTRTCEEIESVLKSQLIDIYPESNIRERLHNADIYSTMAEQGCPENAEKYKDLALRQIDVVSAVSDEQELEQNKETIVDTYEKLQMQEAARNFLNKLDRLINPATDLIYEIGRVVNE